MAGIRTLNDVVQWRLCLGCGACAWACPQNKVRLMDFLEEGIRPIVEEGCENCGDCLTVCPAVQTDFRQTGGKTADGAAAGRLEKDWGPIVGIWEGHATDPEIRFKGSSGGALTAIAAYCVEVLGMHGVLHIGQDPEDPVRNRTRLSRTRSELLGATGSRYSPASVCNGLGLVEAAPAPCVVIGKPVEIAAVVNARGWRPALDAKVGVMLSFFCAETPSTAGTIALLQRLGIAPERVADLRYRGLGWPGHFAPTLQGRQRPDHSLTYRESWAFLQSYRPWSAQLWPDGSGELADISCGDPWYVEPDGHNPGTSIVVARTALGKSIIEGAMAANYLTLKPAEPWKLEKSQPGLRAKKASVWGRRTALKLMGLPVTRFVGLDLFSCWRSLPLGSKLRSTLGTWRRVIQRKLYRRSRLDPSQARPVPPPLAGGGNCGARSRSVQQDHELSRVDAGAGSPVLGQRA